MEAPLVEARPAATVMLIRDSVAGIEVLMVRRRPRGFFGGLTVFPGGAVDPVDASDLAGEVVPGEHTDQEFRAAALRELAEETGLALTIEGVVSAPERTRRSLLSTMRAAGIQLDASALTLVSRWVTPEEAPTRYDTRFYLAIAADTPDIRIDGDELVEHMWVGHQAMPSSCMPMEGLEMFLPTIAHLRWLERRTTVPMPSLPQRAPMAVPWSRRAHGGRQLRAYSPPCRRLMRIQRILANNPGPFTGPGTNTWLVDDGGECVVIDPGPVDDRPPRPDRGADSPTDPAGSPGHPHPSRPCPAGQPPGPRAGCSRLRLCARPRFRPRPAHRRRLCDRHRREPAPGDPHSGSRRRPLCFRLADVLFTGDHIMGGSSVMVEDMGSYLASSGKTPWDRPEQAQSRSRR